MADRIEQLVYGSFRFWDRGYAILGQSPGCRPEWVTAVVAACRQVGHPPADLGTIRPWFSIPLPQNYRAVVGVSPQGEDDQGRPGALAFHALFVPHRPSRAGGSSPGRFVPLLRDDWTPAAQTLGPLDGPTDATSSVRPDPTTFDPQVDLIARALWRRYRVVVESPEPIDRLVRQVWDRRYDGRTRRRLRLATWTFGDPRGFHLAGVPQLVGVRPDATTLVIRSGAAVSPDLVAAGSPGATISRRAIAIGGLGVLAAGVVTAVRVWGRAQPRPPRLAESPPLDAADRARIAAEVRDLAGRLAPFGIEADAEIDLATVMGQVADRVRYRDPSLSAAELARLAGSSDPDRDRALEWHRQTRPFLADHPLPRDFATLAFEGQILALARSFHGSAAASPAAAWEVLRSTLIREKSIRPSPLAATYPALSTYVRFLNRLPRRDDRRASAEG